MYDSLDTMWLMGLEDMFYDTVEDVAPAKFRMKAVRRQTAFAGLLTEARAAGGTRAFL